MRRRDGVALAATGVIPDRVRAQILEEYRAELVARRRDGIRRRLDAGLLPLAIPYGYRRAGDYELAGVDAPTPPAFSPHAHSPEIGIRESIGRDRCAPAVRWTLDPDSAYTVRVAASWARAGITLPPIAARLTADPVYPRPLSARGQPRAWTPQTVAAVVNEPAATGHGVWGRTRYGHPAPPVEWLVSHTATHPEILPPARWHTTRRAITSNPTPPGDDNPWPTGSQ